MSVPLQQLDSSETEARGLVDRVERGRDAGVPGESFVRLLGQAPGYAEAITDAMHEAHFEGTVDHRLKELMRIQLARTAKDPYFSRLRSTEAIEDGLTEELIDAASGDFEQDDRFSEAEKWALRYAYTMYRSPEEVDAAFYDEGKNHFSEAEIMEMGAMIALHYGMQRFAATLPSGVID